MPHVKKFTDAQIESALRATGGLISTTAQLLHEATGVSITRQSIRERILRSPRLQAAIEETQEQALDLAETRLMQAIDKGDVPAIKFYLETKGRWRGFTRRDYSLITADPRTLSDAELDLALLKLEAKVKSLNLDLTPMIDATPALPGPVRRPHD